MKFRLVEMLLSDTGEKFIRLWGSSHENSLNRIGGYE